MRRSFQYLLKSFYSIIQGLSAPTPPIWHASVLAKTRSRYQPFRANSKISSRVSNWHWSPSLRRETAVDRLSFLADFGLTWFPYWRYSRAYWIWIRTCFFSLPLGSALEGTPTRYFKVRATTGGEGRPSQHQLFLAWQTSRHSYDKVLVVLLCLNVSWMNREVKQTCTQLEKKGWITRHEYWPFHNGTVNAISVGGRRMQLFHQQAAMLLSKCLHAQRYRHFRCEANNKKLIWGEEKGRVRNVIPI